MTTLEALEIVLKAIKERFSMKNHKHNIDDVSGLSQVAKTGKYTDLTGLPQIPSVAVAKQNKAGIVMPGSAMYVNEVGALSIIVDGESGLVIEDNVLKISSNSTSSKTIEADSWNDMLETLKNTITENVNKNILDFKVTLKNTRNGKSIVVKLNKDRIDNFNRINEYVFNMLENLTEVPKSDAFAKLDGYSSNFEEFKFCEFFRLLSSEDIVDCVELLLYKKTNANEALEFLGKNLTDVVKVLDIKNRYVALGLSAPDYCNNVVVTYVMKSGETGYEYVPLTSVVGSGETPTPTPEPEPEVEYDYEIRQKEGEGEPIDGCDLSYSGSDNILLVKTTINPMIKIEILNSGLETITSYDIQERMEYQIDFTNFEVETYTIKIYDKAGAISYYDVIKKVRE